MKSTRTATQSKKFIRIPVIRGTVLGVDVVRGYARLCDLALVSKADIYNQKTNPTGTQRDLSPKHAREAYQYVTTRTLAFFPEVFLSARDPSAIHIDPKDGDECFCTLRIDIQAATAKGIAISRVDGNHRLHYADGTHEGFPAVEKPVSFCLAHNLSLEQEIQLFRDINNNQKRMNTSHLDNIEVRLTPEERLRQVEPDLYIAQKLGTDTDSPFFGRVYEGGPKSPKHYIPLRSLRTGISYMFSQATKLMVLDDADAKLKVIKNYFASVREWVPDAWENPKSYLLLRGAGLWGICFIGAEVIDRALGQGKFRKEDMLKILKSGREWNWANSGDFQGFSGRGGAVRIKEMVVGELQDETGVSIKNLFQEIMKS